MNTRLRLLSDQNVLRLTSALGHAIVRPFHFRDERRFEEVLECDERERPEAGYDGTILSVVGPVQPRDDLLASSFRKVWRACPNGGVDPAIADACSDFALA